MCLPYIRPLNVNQQTVTEYLAPEHTQFGEQTEL
jgi:hypothetical protein